MEKTSFPSAALIIAALLLASSIVTGTIYAANTAYRMKTLSNTISVTGSAERRIKSDVAKWSTSISRTVGLDGLKSGYDLLSKDLDAIREDFRQGGVQDNELSIQPVVASPTMECLQIRPDQPCNMKQTGYQLQQSLIVESSDVDKITTLSQESGRRLAERGIMLQGGIPEYFYSKLADVKLEMLAQATESATKRAEQIVQNSGAKLGNVVSANMGVFQVTAVNSIEISDYGMYDTSSIDKKITAIVRASFTIR